MSVLQVERKFVVADVKASGEGRVVARIATLRAKDHDADWIEPGAVKRGAEVIIGSYNHGSAISDALPIGLGVLSVRGDEMLVDGNLWTDTLAGAEHHKVMKHLGARQQWSFSFLAPELGDLTPELRKLGVRRRIVGLDVMEASPVLRGAGVSTATLSVKCTGCGSHGGGCSCTNHGPDPFHSKIDQVRKIIRDNEHRWLDPTPESWKAVLAARVFRFQCAFWGIPAPRPRIRWFRPDGRKSGQYDESRNEILLATHLDEDQLIITIGHELEHHREFIRGYAFSDAAAERAGELLLERWRRDHAA